MPRLPWFPGTALHETVSFQYSLHVLKAQINAVLDRLFDLGAGVQERLPAPRVCRAHINKEGAVGDGARTQLLKSWR